MKSPTILIPVFVADYKIFVLAARLVGKEHGSDAPDAIALIQLQLSNCSPGGIAKDYLDYVGDLAARRRVRLPLQRKPRRARNDLIPGSRQGRLRLVKPADVSRN